MNNSILAIKDYWDSRALKHSKDTQGTTNDIYLRALEIKTVKTQIKNANLLAGAVIIDIGCGDGFSTLELAKEFPDYQFIGVDYSQNMITNAKSNKSDQYKNVEFKAVDIFKLNEVFCLASFDIAITMRVLINLPDFQLQSKALEIISKLLKSNGRYIAIENFEDGQENMNKMRTSLGLPQIPIRWHNLFFDATPFKLVAQQYYRNVEIIDFASTYYYITRIVYSQMCLLQGVEPDYEHPIHRVAVELPANGEYSPVKLVILTKD